MPGLLGVGSVARYAGGMSRAVRIVWGLLPRHDAGSGAYAGDLIMAEMIPLPNRVMGGIFVYGVAHLVYISGYLALGRHLSAPPHCVVPLEVRLVVGCGLWALFVLNKSAPRTLKVGTHGYTLILAAMVGLATAIGLAEARLLLLPTGAVLFLASDLILANDLFRQRSGPFVNEVVWVTYAAGQALIVLSNPHSPARSHVST